MDDLNGLILPIGADPTDLRQGMREAENIIQSSAQRIRSSISGIANIGQQLSGLGATLTASLTVPIVGLATASIQAYGEIQSLQKGLEAVMGSAQRASDEFIRLKEVAKLPGLGLPEAVKGSINLQSIGLSAKNARNILLQFGNAVATVGKGRAEFERAIYGVQQLANTDFPLGEDLNIIKDAIPQVSSLLKEAFGTSRSDDLQKLKVSSKQVLDVILDGLGKLPRVSGGIKGAFENLKDSMTISLGRIGKIIDDAFNISGIVDKITTFVDKIITSFESLNPTIQKVILVVAGLVAALGPLLLAVGGFLALLPTMITGITAIGTAFVALLSPIGLVTIAILGVVTAVVANWGKIKPYFDDTILTFKILYNESLAFRGVIASLTGSVVGFAKTGIEVFKLFYENFKDVGKAVLEVFSGIGKGIEGVLTFNPKKIAEGFVQVILAGGNVIDDLAQNSIRSVLKIGKVFKSTVDGFSDFRFDLTEKIDLGFKGLGEDTGVDKLIPGLAKVKKETQKQLAEIIPEGSIADYRKRAELLRKSIEYTNDGLVKVRGLDKFGKDVDKNGNPYYTGLVLPIIKALDELEKLDIVAGNIDLQPTKINSRGLLDQFGNEFKSLNDLIFSQTTKFAEGFNLLPKTIQLGIDAALIEAARISELTEKLNEGLLNVINSGVTDGITDAFSSIGKSLAEGENVFESLGKSLLGSFGKILGELGKQMIQYGVGLLAIKIAMKSLNPYVAIAAGAALVALGAGISASVANQSDSIGGGGSNISSSAGVSTQNFSASNSSSGGFSGGEVVFRISGPDLIGAINRNLASDQRLNAI